jgi:ubiquinone/menaquinone biosynthesis C-methylase UbiE
MDHADHVRLLQPAFGAANEIGVWADLGAGEGAFTLALADLLPPESIIHAIDRDRNALEKLGRRFRQRLVERGLPPLQEGDAEELPELRTLQADFTRDLNLRELDGIVMANSLHFVKDKAPVLARVRDMLKPGGRLLLVEYDTDSGNTWVPYPLSFDTWRDVAQANGFAEPRLLGTHPSRFLRRIYSALAVKAA